MKKISFFSLLLFCSCFNNPEGRITFYDFNETKYDVEKALLDSIGEDSTRSSWITISETRGVEDIYLHLKGKPEEEYLLGFTCDSLDWKANPNSRLALSGVNYGDGWKFRRDNLSLKERNRIQLRFEKEILSRIKFTYHKSDETGGCKGM